METQQLQIGDMVRRSYDDRLWVLISARDCGHDIYTMKFFDVALSMFVEYTYPWGMRLPDVFSPV